ncbi:unnamed protein product [Schistocephalus solidus]|uniref:Uncharacterized protein n=1 Tax=Schistocephalus solidus TaxID=70667 RepID=A0A183TNG6_SCHSO|nr:unnamed protein product [Schistocephalus solidus]
MDTFTGNPKGILITGINIQRLFREPTKNSEGSSMPMPKPCVVEGRTPAEMPRHHRGFWHCIDTRYLKPLLTHSGPLLSENLPRCCLPLADWLTTADQRRNVMAGYVDLNFEVPIKNQHQTTSAGGLVATYKTASNFTLPFGEASLLAVSPPPPPPPSAPPPACLEWRVVRFGHTPPPPSHFSANKSLFLPLAVEFQSRSATNDATPCPKSG